MGKTNGESTRADRPTAVEVFLTKVETVAEKLHSPDRRELLTAAKICRAEMRKGSDSPWRESFKRS
jgi:hypothetical protein